MNDFTKDELEEIIGSLEYSDVCISESIFLKIQSLIDNYCEHEGKPAYFDSPVPTMKCDKCGEFYR